MTDKESPAPDFEKALTELETLVERMEQGDLTLEQSLQHFERGMQLSRSCQQALDEAKLRVEQLLSSEQGDATEPFDPESD
ncbi:MAG: exodeoxyribonuclease VII small subunit [Xanthomonadales bacterium]|nr:exodeoxyribonuclease VII small subunit [Xanthomonadales bacterium]